MHPVFFQMGNIVGYSYGLMIGLGALLAIFVSEWRAKRRGLDGELVFSAAVWGLFAGLLGAKLTFIASNIKYLFSDPGYVLGTDGFTVYGGVVLGILVGGLIVRRKKVDVPLYLDLVIPQIALAQGFGRIGCFLAGCCYGKPTHSHFGVIFPPEAIAPSGIPLIPTQLISAIGDFLIFIILLLLSNYATDYLSLKPAGKKSFFFLRADPRRTALGLTSNQYVSILFLMAGIALIVYGAKRAKRLASEKPSSE